MDYRTSICRIASFTTNLQKRSESTGNFADLVNKRMDQPSKWLGPTHRRVRHDIPYAMKMALEISQENRSRSGFRREIHSLDVMKAYSLHVLLDTASLNPSVRLIFRLMEALKD